MSPTKTPIPTTIQEKAKRLLELEADKHAAIDNEVEDKQREHGELVYDLSTYTDERDPELWAYLGVDITATLPDLFLVPVVERDAEWSDTFTDVLAAATRQAWLEVFGIEFLESVERRNNRIAAASDSMSRAEIEAAGKLGFGKKDIETARLRRRNTG